MLSSRRAHVARWRICAFPVLGLVLAGLLAQPALSTPFAVTKIADTNDGACNADCSLREAIVAANGTAGPDTISVPAGTYQITISPGPDENAAAAGDFDITDSVTITGLGAASTIVTALDADRVFDVNPFGSCTCTVSFSGLTIQHGKAFASNFNVGGGLFVGNNTTIGISDSTIANNQSQNSTGGGIENRGTLTLTNVAFQSNTAFGSGGAINSIRGLTVTGGSFTSNHAEAGGALYINTDSSVTATVTGASFSSNSSVVTAGGVTDDGGAVAIDTDGSVNITKSTFTGNSSANNGGAVYFHDSSIQAAVGTLTMSYDRVVGNTATGSGSGVFGANGAPTIEKNWWGCNGGPSAAPCNRVVGSGDFTPWIILRHLASPPSIPIHGTSTLTADFFRNSDATTNLLTDLPAFIGLPITFGNPVLGTLSNQQPSIQANGTATAKFTAGNAGGNGSADATVDSGTATAAITITVPTSVLASQMAARRTSAGVRLHWRTATEVGLLGFEVYRRAPTGWKRLNRTLVPVAARPSSTYRWIDRAAPARGRLVYRLLGVRVDGSGSWLSSAVVTP